MCTDHFASRVCTAPQQLFKRYIQTAQHRALPGSGAR
jgi:hypothetical protein